MALRGLKFYTVKEVSQIMQVRIETVLRWIYSKKIKASKLPGSRVWRIREEDIETFMELGSNMIDNIDESDLVDILTNDIEDIKIVKEEVNNAPRNSKSNVQGIPDHKENQSNTKNHNAITKDKDEEMIIKAEVITPTHEYITVDKPPKFTPEDVVATFTF